MDLAGLGNGELALTFLPVLRFDHDALWRPHLVDDYLEHASLTRPEATDKTIAEHSPLEAHLETSSTNPAGNPLFALDARCRSGAARRREAARPRRAETSSSRSSRTARSTRACSGRATGARRRASPTRWSASALSACGRTCSAQAASSRCWFLYEYDEWVSAGAIGGRIVQRHEGDLGGGDGRLRARPPAVRGLLPTPLRRDLGSSGTTTCGLVDTAGRAVRGGGRGDGAACSDRRARAGRWRPGAPTPTPPSTSPWARRRTTRPSAPTRRRTSRPARAFPSGAVTLLSYTWNVPAAGRGSAYTWIPRRAPADRRHAAADELPGTWGAKDTIQFAVRPRSSDPDRPGGRGPRTPTRQPLWLRPDAPDLLRARGWKPNTGSRNYRC